MRNTRKVRLRGLFAAMGGAALLLGALAATDASAQIATSRHDLTVTGSGPRYTPGAGGSSEICVFCHTPHGATTLAQPLWNRTLPTAAPAYQVYNAGWSSTVDGQTATDGPMGGGAIGSVSIACLSCHDGTVAVNAVINAPGSGLNAAWRTGGTWANIGTVLTGTTFDAVMAATTISMLGRDMRDDHPIGIQYCGGGPTQAVPGTACIDVDFKAPAFASIGGQNVFWVRTQGRTTGPRNKADLPLYGRTFAAGAGPSVECASCHDAHLPTFGSFLRTVNTGSVLCLSCHTK